MFRRRTRPTTYTSRGRTALYSCCNVFSTFVIYSVLGCVHRPSSGAFNLGRSIGAFVSSDAFVLRRIRPLLHLSSDASLLQCIRPHQVLRPPALVLLRRVLRPSSSSSGTYDVRLPRVRPSSSSLGASGVCPRARVYSSGVPSSVASSYAFGPLLFGRARNPLAYPTLSLHVRARMPSRCVCC